jgi:hypothetical protein
MGAAAALVVWALAAAVSQQKRGTGSWVVVRRKLLRLGTRQRRRIRRRRRGRRSGRGSMPLPNPC